MRLTVAVVITDEHEVFVFPCAAAPEDELRVTWALWEKPELASEISLAVRAALDAMQGQATETMRLFFSTAHRKLAEEERRLDERARRQEWAT